MTESTHTKKVRALQAIKILREFYDNAYQPHYQEKIKFIKATARPKFLISVKHIQDQSEKTLDALFTLQREIEGFPE